MNVSERTRELLAAMAHQDADPRTGVATYGPGILFKRAGLKFHERAILTQSCNKLIARGDLAPGSNTRVLILPQAQSAE